MSLNSNFQRNKLRKEWRVHKEQGLLFEFPLMVSFISQFGLGHSHRLVADPTPALVAPFGQPHAADFLVKSVIGSSTSSSLQTFVVAAIAIA